jgi:hypothetical protein
MHPNEELIHGFYQAFQKLNGEAMAACYHSDAKFKDEVFTLDSGKGAGDMWRMLCGNAKDLRVEYKDVKADDQSGTAHWEAWYTFSATGRKVHNVIEAKFEFKDGKIFRHHDSFSFWNWSKQALGTSGMLLGWTSFLKGKVQGKAMGGLRKFQGQ